MVAGMINRLLLRRALPTIAVALALVNAGLAGAAPVPPGTTARVTEEAVALGAPQLGAGIVSLLHTRMPWTPRPQVLMVTGEATDAAGRQWYRVQLPQRPNGRTAWMRGSQLELGRTPLRIRVLVGSRRLELWNEGVRVMSVPAGVGSPSTPTPTGTFAVHDMLPPPPGAAGFYGRHILAVTAHSAVLRSFMGGEARIAIHGTGNPARVGNAVTNGCVVLDDRAISFLRDSVTPGTPVEIVTG